MSKCNDWIGGVVVGIGTRQKADLGDYLVCLVGKINPYGRSWPYGYYKTTY